MLEALLLCAGCHGMAGEGRAQAGYPRIAGQPPAYLERQLEAYADGRRQSRVMAPLAKRLNTRERATVAAHFASQVVEVPKKSSSLENERGETLARIGDERLRVQACQNCHGPNGIGQWPTGPYLAGLEAAYLRREMIAFRDGSRRSDPSGSMAVIARHLGERDIEAVAAYFAALPPPARPVP